MASIKKNFALSSAYQILSVVTPIVTTPYLSRSIGVDGNGVFAYTQSIANYFVLFAALGMSSYGVRAVAECGESRSKRSLVFWNAFTMNLLFGLGSLSVYMLYATMIADGNMILSAIWGLWVAGSTIDASWLFFGVEEFGVPTARNFITKIASVAMILLCVDGPGDVWIYVLAIAGANFANSVISWPFIWRYVDYVKPTWKEMKKHIKPNLILFIPVVAVSFYSLFNKIMLGAMTSAEQIGLFDYSEKISKIPMAVITALGSAVLPRMTSLLSSGKEQEGKTLVETTMWGMLICAFALCFGIVGIAPSFTPVFFGEGYDDCVLLMSLLAFIIPAVCATNVIGNQYLLPCHRDYEFTVSVSIGAIVNLVLNLLLIPRWGAAGAALGSVACELTVLFVQMRAVKENFCLRRLISRCFPYLIFGIIMSIFIRTLDVLIRPTLGLYASFIVEFISGAALYTLLAVIWAIKHDMDCMVKLFPACKKRDGE